jgi:hypothetical protein
VVAVVIDDAVGGRQIFGLETPLRTREGGKGAGDEGELRAAAVSNGDGGEGIEDVVLARDGEFDVAEGLTVLFHGEGGRAFEVADVGGGVVRFLRGAVPAVGEGVGAVGADFAGDGILGAIYDVSRSLIGEGGEYLLDVVEVAVEIEVFGLDVEDHGVLGAVEGEGSVDFIAFGDHVGSLGGPGGVVAEDGDFGADVVAGFEACLAEEVGGHGGGGGFAVGAGDEDALAGVEDGGEAFGAAQQGDAGGAGGGEGGVFRADGGGVYDEVRAIDGLIDGFTPSVT